MTGPSTAAAGGAPPRRRWPVLEVLLGTGFVVLLVLVATRDRPPALDARVFAHTPPGSGHDPIPALSAVARFITDVGEPISWSLGTVVLATAVALARHWWFPLRLVVLPVAVEALVTVTVKALVARPGPPLSVASGSSGFFPSGHTATALVCTGAIAALVAVWHPAWARMLRAAVVVWSLVMAAALVYVGYHWLTDVLASLLLGFLILRVGCPRLWGPQASGDDPPTEDDPLRLRENA